MRATGAMSRLAGCAAAALALLLAVPGGARAQEWQFGASSYLWLAGMSGKLKAGPASGAEFDVSFGEIFKNLTFLPPPVMLSAEARNGRFAIVTDFIFMKVEQDLDTRGVLFGGGDVSMSSLEWSVAGYYRLLDGERAKIDLGGGFRLWNIRTKAKLDPGQLPGRTATLDELFVDPILSVRALFPFAQGWSATVAGDIGGFGISSKLTWQALGTVNYQVTSWSELRLGYRYLAVDRSKIDMALHGPIVGASFRF